MNKFYFIALFLSLALVIRAENIVNGGFESWAANPTRPTNWYTSNVTSTDTTVRPDAPGHSGSLSAKITVVAPNNIPSLGSTETTGALDTVAQPYVYLNFWYKTSLISGDALKITCTVYKSDGINIAGNISPPGYVLISANTSAWTPYSIPITYYASGAAKVDVKFTIEHPGGGPTSAGSTARIDDVAMSDNFIGIREIEETSKLEIYPNPVRDVLHFKTAAAKPMQIKLSDALGNVVVQKMSSEPMIGYINESLNVESLSSGVYFLMLTSDKKTILRRVIIE
jgi:hypothetical protein